MMINRVHRDYVGLRKLLLLAILCLALGTKVSAQEERSLLRSGNEHYEDEAYEQAQDLYQQSRAVNGSYGKAAFNLGNALYRQNNLGEASKQFEIAAADAFEKEDKAKAFHNVGNSFLNAARYLTDNPPTPEDSVEVPDPQQLIKASIEAYKQALRNTPTDEESRYNLAYAQKLLKEEGGGGGQDQEDQQQDQGNQEQNEEQEDKGDKGDEEQEQEQQENEQGDKGDQKEEQQGDKPNNEMSKEEAEQLLEALDKNEKDLQEKLGKERMQGERIKIEKDW